MTSGKGNLLGASSVVVTWSYMAKAFFFFFSFCMMQDL